mmetsp:Transcript_9872/g.13964  ORF Transcript_9872/g.13964 Transcript_9872/m.13964 type:complete len:123 (+) Transcript_9872:41-409(+)
MNPWNLPVWQWMHGGVFYSGGAIAFYDYLVVGTIEWMTSMKRERKRQRNDNDNDTSISNDDYDDESILLPTRRSNQQPVRYVSLDTKSIIFLVINSVDECMFVQRLLHYIWNAPEVSLEHIH